MAGLGITKPRGYAMGTWLPHVQRGVKDHHVKRLARPSRTTGKSKGINLTALQKWMCRRNRSYKHPFYEQQMALLGQRKTKRT